MSMFYKIYVKKGFKIWYCVIFIKIMDLYGCRSDIKFYGFLLKLFFLGFLVVFWMVMKLWECF